MEFFNRNVIPLNLMFASVLRWCLRPSSWAGGTLRWWKMKLHLLVPLSVRRNVFTALLTPSGPSRESKTSGISWEIIKSSIENDHHHSFLLLRLSSLSPSFSSCSWTNLYRLKLLHHFDSVFLSHSNLGRVHFCDWIIFFGSLDHSWKCSQKRVSHHYVYELIKFEVLLYIEIFTTILCFVCFFDFIRIFWISSHLFSFFFFRLKNHQRCSMMNKKLVKQVTYGLFCQQVKLKRIEKEEKWGANRSPSHLTLRFAIIIDSIQNRRLIEANHTGGLTLFNLSTRPWGNFSCPLFKIIPSIRKSSRGDMIKISKLSIRSNSFK